jgi:hypothetical protein
MDEDRPGTAEEGQHCTWCGTLLSDGETRRARRPVCARCVRLLTTAGIPDEEMYGPPPDDPEGPSSRR